jgi:hypothetical protein
MGMSDVPDLVVHRNSTHVAALLLFLHNLIQALKEALLLFLINLR